MHTAATTRKVRFTRGYKYIVNIHLIPYSNTKTVHSHPPHLLYYLTINICFPIFLPRRETPTSRIKDAYREWYRTFKMHKAFPLQRKWHINSVILHYPRHLNTCFMQNSEYRKIFNISLYFLRMMRMNEYQQSSSSNNDECQMNINERWGEE